MSATHGSTRKVGRLVVCCIAAVLALSAVFATAASASKPAPTPASYVAMGDSVSYGYSQQKFEENYPAEPASAFEGGFVNLLGEKLSKLAKKANNTLTTVNLSCPGEVSDGLLGENKALGGGQEANGKSDSAPCGWHNTNGFPRHFEYGSVSQLEAAIGITTGAIPVGTPTFATIQIGSNDELAVVGACETPAYLSAHGFPNGTIECLLHEVSEAGYYYEKGAFYHIIHNIGTAIGVLRAYGFTGEVGVLGFYNPQAQILPGSDTLQSELNSHLKAAIDGKAFGEGVYFANPFSKTNPPTQKAEEKRICKYTEECNKHDKKVNAEKALGHAATEEEAAAFPGDIHPTPEGHALFAKILFKALKNKEDVE